MGRIKRFNLKKLIHLNKAVYFFETGTWKGDGLAYAAKYDFEKLYSSEIISSIAEKAKKRFEKDSRIIIINEPSTESLIKYIPELKGNAIFWLDAHFPGAEEGLKDYNETSNETVKLPLQKELEIIATRKKHFADILLIDDLRIYETGNFDSGNLPPNVLPPEIRSIEFAYQLFRDSHVIMKSYKDEGYLLIIPKKTFRTGILQKFLFKIENSVFNKIT